jgi:hypothetical protein
MTKQKKLLIWTLALGLGACGADDRSARAADSAAVAADTAAPAPGTAATSARMAPAQIRGIYLNAYASGSAKRLATLLALADSTEINTFVVDVKDEKGMRYRTALAAQKEIGGEVTMSDLQAVVDSIHAHGVWASARIVVFKDPMLSRAKPEWSIKNPDGGLWQDKAGNTWVSAWDPNVWEYNIQIAEEVLAAGFDEVQFDYVRFPEPFPSLPKQVHPNAKGDRTDAIVAFLNTARPRIRAKGGVVAADVFGLSPDDPADVQIGQQWESILATADHVLPMTYPSHYLPSHLKGVPKPNQMPYETILQSVGIGVIRAQRLRTAGVTEQARVIPWLQGFSAPWVTKNYPYGAEQAAAQIRGVYDVGLEDWVFWHPGSKYELISAAFEKGETRSRAKKFEPTAEMVAQVDLVDRMGSKSAREKVAAAVKAAN